MKKGILTAFGLNLLLVLLGASFAQAAPPDPKAYLMDEAEELRIAATAGPKEITEGASYYVLRPDGYEKVREGANGFHCFVERSWGGPMPDNSRIFDPRVRAPHCIIPEGARTTMQELFLFARLAMQGKTAEEIEPVIDRAYADGTLTLPESLSLTYMMSKHQWLGERVTHWHPHVMLWIPYLTEADVGPIAGLRAKNAHLVGKPGSRRSCLVFPVPEFIE